MQTDLDKSTTDLDLESSSSLVFNLELYLDKLVKADKSNALSLLIKSSFLELLLSYVSLSDKEYKNYIDKTDVNIDQVYLLHYTLIPGIKNLIILHRDVLLQLQISRHKLSEDIVDLETFNTHFEESKLVLENATISILKALKAKEQFVKTKSKAYRKELNIIQHQENPWIVYKEQLLVLEAQCIDILKKDNVFETIQLVFKEIKKYNFETLDKFKETSLDLIERNNQLISKIENLKDASEISTITNWIDATIKSYSDSKFKIETFNSAISSFINNLEKTTFPIATQDGNLLLKTIDFNKSVQKWCDFELVPFYIDLDENINNVLSYFRHNWINLKTSLLVEKSNNEITFLAAQVNTLNAVKKTLRNNEIKINDIISPIKDKLQNEFLETNIYSDSTFLDVSFQTSFSQMASEKSNLFYKLKDALKKSLVKLTKTYQNSIIFSNVNNLEASIETINYRLFKEENAHYDTLFLNKNFLGDLFLRPREYQDKKLNTSIEQWRKGFKKAVLVTGDSLSGKSTFINHSAHNYFKKNTLYLLPNTTLTLGGNKFNTSTDLKTALLDVKKSVTNTNTLVVIEDLELWRDKTNSLLSNVRALKMFLETVPEHILVIVSVSKLMQFHLDKRMPFTDLFSSEIDVSKATFDEIFKAVMLRHSASHKTIVGLDLTPLTNLQIERNVSKLAKRLDYNIGEILQAWTFGTTLTTNNTVIYNDLDLKFKDFFNNEELTILKQIIRYRQLTELELKNYVGETYADGFNSAIKRLLNTKVIIRNTNNYLVLNTVLYSDIKQLLIYKGTLN
ncbi:hypothetical protein [Aurantibacter sp.]|uniref:hypothetical protein n=1 Tax=Aurantibacter sp. TaxID=2807103 RepID=UPI0035C863AF